MTDDPRARLIRRHDAAMQGRWMVWDILAEHYDVAGFEGDVTASVDRVVEILMADYTDQPPPAPATESKDIKP